MHDIKMRERIRRGVKQSSLMTVLTHELIGHLHFRQTLITIQAKKNKTERRRKEPCRMKKEVKLKKNNQNT